MATASMSAKMERLNKDNFILQNKLKAAISYNPMERRGRRTQRSGPMVVKHANLPDPVTDSRKAKPVGGCYTKTQVLTSYPTKTPTRSPPPTPVDAPPPLEQNLSAKTSSNSPKTLLTPLSPLLVRMPLSTSTPRHTAMNLLKPSTSLVLPKKLPLVAKPPEPHPKVSNVVLSAELNEKPVGITAEPSVTTSTGLPPAGVPTRRNKLHRPASMLVLPTHGYGVGLSSTRTRPHSPSYLSSGRRTPSPGSALDPAFVESIRQKVCKVQRARLYLLQQPGPHSFLVVADSPEHKYKVIIGPQTCTCGRDPHCIHVLFVMLRVFQLRESDPKLFSKTLKNFEVEELIRQFQMRRKKQATPTGSLNSLKQPQKNIFKLSRSESSLSDALSNGQAQLMNTKGPENDESSSLCPICLLEMVEGESLVRCELGCRNKLHHHCISIWAEECRQQKEKILCPLCRAQWSSAEQQNWLNSKSPKHLPDSRLLELPDKTSSPRQTNHLSLPYFTNICHSSSNSSSTSSTLTSCSTKSSILSKSTSTKSIPHLSIPESQTWLLVFGNKFVSYLFSSVWSHRENALRWLSRQVISVLYVAKGINSSSKEPPETTNLSKTQRLKDCDTVVESCCKVVVHMLNDPVYKVYISALGLFRAILSYSPCVSSSHLLILQNRTLPIIKAILLKCTDGNRRTSQLSLATLIELVHGQEGSMAVGQNTQHPALNGLGGLDFLVNCAFEDEEDSPKVTKHWKWLLGRLAVAERLIQEFPQEFSLLYSNCFPFTNTTDPGDVPFSPENQIHYQRLITLLGFAKQALEHPHTTVSKMATRVFIMVSRLSAHVPPVFAQVFDMIADIDVNVQNALIRKLELIMKELHLSGKAAGNQPPSKFLDVPSRKQRNIDRTQEKKLLREKLQLEEENGLLHRNSIDRLSGRSFSFSFETSGSRSSSVKRPRPSFLPLSQPNKPAAKPCQNSQTKVLCDSAFQSEQSTPVTPSTCGSEWNLTSNEAKTPETPLSPDGLSIESLRAFPIIPGLRDSPDEDLVISLQPDLADCKGELVLKDQYYGRYTESIHWNKGPLLGTGAFSSCYQARDDRTGILMAVKQLSFYRNNEVEQEKVMEAIKDEIVMMSKLRHHNIIRILGATQQGGHYNVFVEWMAGGSVASLLDRYGPFNEQVILRYTWQVLDGLAYLHENQILHRDLKGANLLVDSTGHHIRIADFGAAARLCSQATMAGEFQGQLLGTIAFMAPEVLRGEDYGRSCDVWSVGCIIIEMATAKPPWNANDISNHLALIFKIACSSAPPNVPDYLSKETQDLALHCLSLKSEDRPTAKDLMHHHSFYETPALAPT